MMPQDLILASTPPYLRELAEQLARGGCRGKRRPYQDSIRTGFCRALDITLPGHPALRHDGAFRRHLGDDPQGSRCVYREGIQVATVYADHRGSRVQCGRYLYARVDLDERSQAQLVDEPKERLQARPQSSRQMKHSEDTGRARLPNL